MARKYEMNQRAKSQEAKRRRIVDATVDLHQEKGIRATSMRDVAKRAGVGVATVYRHFPDETALVAACSGSYFERNPLPDPASWREEADPVARVRRGLKETYGFYRRTRAMLSSVLSELQGSPVIAPFTERWRVAAEVLLEPWSEDRSDRAALPAAISLALRFETWSVLADEHGLDDGEAAALMLRLVCDCRGQGAGVRTP